MTESTSTGDVANPYGMTKWLCEKLLEEKSRFSNLQGISLRYFNPIGAHPTGLIGEQVFDIPNNIFPYIMKVVSGELSDIKVFGDDYPTVDGTGVRDYIDIMDLSDGHIAALNHLSTWSDPGFDAINL
jgi:UDP-glucose 4-epimerase